MQNITHITNKNILNHFLKNHSLAENSKFYVLAFLHMSKSQPMSNLSILVETLFSTHQIQPIKYIGQS